MRICVISNDPYPPKRTGMGRTAPFVEALARFGHEVEVYNLDPRPGRKIDQIKRVNLTVRHLPLVEVPLLLRRNFDVVANMDPVILNLPAPFLSKIRGIPMLSELQDPVDEWRVMGNSIGRKVFGYIFRSSDFVTTTHDNLKHQLIEKLHVDPEKIGVINNGVDMSVFRPMPVDKDIDVLYTGSPFSFERLVSRVRRECQSRGKAFLWTPRDRRYPSDELPLVLNRSKICIFPAEQGHWHIKLMEYLACGCAVVALETEQTKKIISDGKNGLLANTEDEFIEKIFYLLGNNELRGMLAENSRESVKDYSWENLARQFETYLKKAVDNRE